MMMRTYYKEVEDMPTYHYRCPKCGKFTITQKITEKALTECPTCGAAVNRLIGKNINIIYKCSGFYCTDTHSPNGTAEVREETKSAVKNEVKSTENSEGKSTAKSEAKTELKAEKKSKTA